MENTKNILKISYMMLSISITLISIFYIVAIIVSIILCFVAAKDVNGGGWIIFFILLLFIFMIPFLIVHIISFIFWIIGLKSLNEKEKSTSVFGLISSGIIFGLGIEFVPIVLDLTIEFKNIFILGLTFPIIYSFINVLFFIFVILKENGILKEKIELN